MAVRGLGCPVRFTLTAGQRGDCPQAYALIDGLPAKVVMADAAYDADRLRQVIADKDAVAVIPNNPSRAQRYPIDKHLYAQRHLSNVASQSSNSSDASRHASRKQPETISPSSPSQLPSYGSDNCPQLLVLDPDEFAASIAERLYAVKRRESPPRVTSLAIKLFGLPPGIAPEDMPAMSWRDRARSWMSRRMPWRRDS